MLALCLLVSACSQQPVIEEDMMHFTGPMPADFGGSWDRNYARGDDMNLALREAYNSMIRRSMDPRNPGGQVVTMPSSKDTTSLMALARLMGEIVRPDVLTIFQDEYEIRVEREEDFAMSCAFYGGVARGTDSDYGTEICGWNGSQLIHSLVLPDGLQVTHRFSISTDRQQLRVVTTVASSASRTPFTLQRFYYRFEKPSSGLNCIETLSMKRVCSTTDIVP